MTLRVACLLALLASLGSGTELEEARGRVFDDRNGNGSRDEGEAGVPGVRVSNGREVVVTDEQGRYSLPVTDDTIVFVIKPRGWMTPLSPDNLPLFHYVHKPAGSPPGLEFPGVAPTGDLPASIDFPLRRAPEPDRFRMVVFGDPQSRNLKEVDYLARDVVEELIGVDAAFGTSLGDIAFDDLSVLEPQNAVVGRLGIPWHHVHGNHDMNYDVATDELADETWERIYGPPTYSFDWGPVHFIVLDGVAYEGDPETRKYHSELGRHLEFVEADLRHVARDQLVVLLMHIPLLETVDRQRLFDLLADFPHTFSLAAHYHYQRHVFFGAEEGWKGAQPHHHLIHATACGSWWSGVPDEIGIPNATMMCGAPNGYSIVSFDGNRYSVRFKAARRPAQLQMHVWAPASIAPEELESARVWVNVFAGSERSRVEMRVGGGEWAALERRAGPDPYYMAMKAGEVGVPPPGRALPEPVDSPHLWVGGLPVGLESGAHVIEVRTTDMFGRTDHGRRVMRVE